MPWRKLSLDQLSRLAEIPPGAPIPTDGTAHTVQWTIFIYIVIGMLAAAAWDGYCWTVNKPELTVSRIIRNWRDHAIVIVVLASFLFYHLFVE